MSPTPEASKVGEKGFRSSEKGFLSSEKGFRSSEKGFLSSGKGFRSSEKGFLSSEKGFLSSEKGFLSSEKGFRSAGEGFLTAGKAFHSIRKGFRWFVWLFRGMRRFLGSLGNGVEQLFPAFPEVFQAAEPARSAMNEIETDFVAGIGLTRLAG